MKRAILFRYHHINKEICLERLSMLKKYNPEIEIHGLFGGEKTLFAEYEELTKDYIAFNFCLENSDDRWKWLSSDLCTRIWFEKIGNTFEFDMLHIIEWDLLLFDSISNLYKYIPKDGMALTGLSSVSNLYGKWCWVSIPEWTMLLNHVRLKYGYNKKPFGSLGPGTSIPRRFLENFSKFEVPAWCNDEVRFPLFGQLIGCKLYNNNFFHNWFDNNEKRFFNCDNIIVQRETIITELSKDTGRRVFHPYRALFYKNCQL